MPAPIYVETTIIRYLAARPSRDPIVAARQEITSSWWNSDRTLFELVVSRAVLAEAERGEPAQARARLDIAAPLTVLHVTPAARLIAKEILHGGFLSPTAAADALHIALAAVHGMDYLLTWNLRHIANPLVQRRTSAIFQKRGYRTPVLCTPRELMGSSGDTVL